MLEYMAHDNVSKYESCKGISFLVPSFVMLSSALWCIGKLSYCRFLYLA